MHPTSPVPKLRAIAIMALHRENFLFHPQPACSKLLCRRRSTARSLRARLHITLRMSSVPTFRRHVITLRARSSSH
ncbi:hypothetical protein I7I50_04148 [Histoplasma capsulatum G186AR]|uniref:Uncharacterized protein n=1 Tax=Ajellomyces capsulatus TaxID=5037 RepID=A0A8H7YP61_AJECA|nr:hypothetical protein I7I52_05056 [Histoplasma capsulatum]QSS75115.1 hypothetical protein I7I50_04148 [Histoplasma capsulatum G186AR]